ncbi:MAG: ribulokinase, partial [Clostridia bacterium]|nr:ribulokinase [Clostridia bacterium]
MKQYLIGLDFGTLSVRALLMDAETGMETAVAEYIYPHAVMDHALPNGRPLPERFALQHPQDYLDGMKQTVAQVLAKGKVKSEAVVGICVDFTSCTVVAMNEAGVPLCLLEEFADEPHAYVKLWKHHGALEYAEEINQKAEARGEAWLATYGGKISCEWMLPKVLETLREAPKVFDATARFADAGDWLSFLLTGKHTAAAGFAGLKTLWRADHGFPSNDFFKAVDPRLDGIMGAKLCNDVYASGSCVGRLTAMGAELCGLAEGTPLAAPLVDGGAPMAALNVTGLGEMSLVVGTSNVDHVLGTKPIDIPGICGYVKGSIVPEYYTFEAGQAGVGDIFSWFVHNCVPRAYEEEATACGMNIHAYLRKKASALRVGENHLIALDWFNGNRNILKDDALSGMIVGLTLNTRPEEIYRALIEATAFGTRMIVENFEANGLPVERVCVAGGIAQKDPMMMQIYADVLKKELRVVDSAQAAARGSAIYAAVAAGLFADVPSTAVHYALPEKARYTPDPSNAVTYDALYAEYQLLHDYFGRGTN